MKPIIDISAWQPPSSINYDRLANEVSGVILRVAYGTRADIHFATHYREFRARNIPVGAYHYIVEYKTVAEQITTAMTALGDRKLQLGFWVDVELEENATPLRAVTAVAYTREIEARLGYKAGIYTSASMWRSIFGNNNPLADRDLWVAYYTTGNVPILPTGWSTWNLWQYTSEGRLNGYTGDLDTNRFSGTQADFDAWAGNVGEPVDPPTDPNQPLYSVKITTTPPNRYITYNAPNGVRWNEERWLQSGDIVPVWEESGHWLRIDALPRWINGSFMQWVKRVDTPQPPVAEIMYYGATYWQRDPRWRDKPLGTKSTIGANGCAMTCVAIALGKIGMCVNPVSLNDWLNNNGGYANGNLIIWDAVERMNPTIKWDGMTYGPSDDLIKQRIRAGKLPIIVVDFDEHTPQEDMHWVIGIGVDRANNIIIHDPWDNVVGRFRDKYAKSVIRLCTYSKRS